jgi:hypothetical protein
MIRTSAREARFRRTHRTTTTAPNPAKLAAAQELAARAFREHLSSALDRLHAEAVDAEDWQLADLTADDDDPEKIAELAQRRPDLLRPVVEQAVASLPDGVRDAIRAGHAHQLHGADVASLVADGLRGVDPEGRLVQRAGATIRESVDRHGMSTPSVLHALAQTDDGPETILRAHERGDLTDEEFMRAGALDFDVSDDGGPEFDPAGLAAMSDDDIRRAIDGVDPFWTEFEIRDTAAQSLAAAKESARKDAATTAALARMIDHGAGRATTDEQE